MNPRFLILFAAILIYVVAAMIADEKKEEATDAVIVIDQHTPRETITELHDSPKVKEAQKLQARPQDKVVSETITKELKEVLQTLPTLDHLKKMDTHDVHHTPVVLKESGVMIGKILQKAETDPSRRKPTLEFLLNCAEGKDYAPAVRAVCWNSLLTHISQWKIFFPVSKAKVPPSIKSLALKLQ